MRTILAIGKDDPRYMYRDQYIGKEIDVTYEEHNKHNPFHYVKGRIKLHNLGTFRCTFFRAKLSAKYKEKKDV